MNKINFITKDNFPLSADTMDMLQQMINQCGSMAALGGTNYILTGCVTNGANVSAGVVVINNEILPFAGGALKTKVTIEQTTKTLTAFGINYPEAYVHRTVKFSDTGEYVWADFTQVLTNKELEARFNALKGEPAGFVKMWSGRIDRIPEEFRLCDGSIVTTAQYPALAYSQGKENMESFPLPDLRKRFVAGYDSTAEGYAAIGTTGGDEKVILTPEQMPNHSHKIEFIDEKWGDNANSRPFPNPAGTSGYTAETTSTGGGQSHENRPPYYVLAFVIKVK